ncbi:rhamnose mutarotase [Pseudovirgaria hyperparasitica]|uniref:Rhamnose mutarotase n=1 Tax=Pseudovirgaria hyperparasitica TaxID=470096 RepID=A0A6A6WH81_9PEZI|nr:rhamnose mutarotase [Pseudovirgaria hyperparasitica]KAF2761007.1 rhamnose mutarotase [Pseudovirgaria hyperparasitica]
MTTPQTKRIGQYVHLKPDSLKAYKACHAAVWPAVLAQIHACNIHDYSIYYDSKTNILFAAFKWTGTDWDADMKAMAENKTVQEWWEMTDAMQVSPTGARSSVEGGWWRELEEVFYFA